MPLYNPPNGLWYFNGTVWVQTGTIDGSGNLLLSGALVTQSYLALNNTLFTNDGILYTMNKAASAWLPWATRNASGAEAVMELRYITVPTDLTIGGNVDLTGGYYIHSNHGNILELSTVDNYDLWLSGATGAGTAGKGVIIRAYTSGGWVEALKVVNGSTAQATITANLRLALLGAGTLVTDASGNVTASSDARLKDIGAPFLSGLDAIRLIQPVRFHWNELSGMDRDHEYVGFVAQDVQKAIPEAVGENASGHLTLQDRPILAALVNAVKEQQSEIDELTRQVRELRAMVDAIVRSAAAPEGESPAT